MAENSIERRLRTLLAEHDAESPDVLAREIMTLVGAEVERLRERIDALAQGGDFDRWMRLAHLDRRNGTTEARDAIRAWFDAREEA